MAFSTREKLVLRLPTFLLKCTVKKNLPTSFAAAHKELFVKAINICFHVSTNREKTLKSTENKCRTLIKN